MEGGGACWLCTPGCPHRPGGCGWHRGDPLSPSALITELSILTPETPKSQDPPFPWEDGWGWEGRQSVNRGEETWVLARTGLDGRSGRTSSGLVLGSLCRTEMSQQPSVRCEPLSPEHLSHDCSFPQGCAPPACTAPPRGGQANTAGLATTEAFSWALWNGG